LTAPAAADKGKGLTTPPEVEQFKSYVEQLSSMPEDPKHAPILGGLRRLADALDALPTRAGVDLKPRTAAIRQYANRLEASPAKSRQHTSLTRLARDEALGAIGDVHTSCESPSTIDGSVRSARSAVSDVNPELPLRRERPSVDRARGEISDLLSEVSTGEGDCLTGAVAEAEPMPWSRSPAWTRPPRRPMPSSTWKEPAQR
jgi:hypothetical protein